MLYRTYELRRACYQVGGQFLDREARALRKAPSRLGRTVGVRAALAAVDLYDTLQLTHDRPAFGIDSVGTGLSEVPLEQDLVLRTPFATLLRFRKADGSSDAQPKVLVVPALAGHFATLVRGTVAAMVQDHDVYLVDWHNARDVPTDAGPFGLDEYIEHVMDFLREVGPGTHLMSVCQPAVACLAAASLMEEDGDPARPSSLILMAGPVDTSVNPGKVNRVAARQSVGLLERTMLQTVPKKFPGRGRKVYPGFLQVGGFMSMDPGRHVEAFRGLYQALVRGDEAAARKTRDFYGEYFAVLDIAGELYIDTVKRVFKDHDLPLGRFTWRGRGVDPTRITSALFTIEGALDELCTPGQTQAAHVLCAGIPSGRHRHLLQDGVGHYGVFGGSTFEREIYPQIRDFVHAYDGPHRKAGS